MRLHGTGRSNRSRKTKFSEGGKGKLVFTFQLTTTTQDSAWQPFPVGAQSTERKDHTKHSKQYTNVHILIHINKKTNIWQPFPAGAQSTKRNDHTTRNITHKKRTHTYTHIHKTNIWQPFPLGAQSIERNNHTTRNIIHKYTHKHKHTQEG